MRPAPLWMWLVTGAAATATLGRALAALVGVSL